MPGLNFDQKPYFRFFKIIKNQNLPFLGSCLWFSWNSWEWMPLILCREQDCAVNARLNPVIPPISWCHQWFQLVGRCALDEMAWWANLEALGSKDWSVGWRFPTPAIDDWPCSTYIPKWSNCVCDCGLNQTWLWQY